MITILTDLDSLLDTRLGVMARINPDAAKKLVTSPLYWVREQDNWELLTEGLVTNDMFERAWLNRTNDDLKASKMTGLILVISRILGEYNRVRMDNRPADEITLEINLHPYTLTEEEKDELEHILSGLLYSDLPITFVSQSLEELTPKRIKGRYDAMVFYDFPRWIKQHFKALTENPIPAFSIIAPRLFEKDPSKLPLERKQEELMHFRLWLLQYLNVDFIDVSCFSMLRLRPDEQLESVQKSQ